MISKSFLKSSIIYTVGGALPMVSSFILLPFYVEILDTKQFVSLNFYIGISLLFQILFSYSVDSYFGVKYSQLAGDLTEQKRFTGTVSNLLLLIGFFITLIALVAGPLVFPMVFTPEDQVNFWPFGIMSIITAFFNSYFKAGTNALIYFKQPNQFILFNSVNFFITVGLSIFGLYYSPNTLDGPLYARFISGLVIFILALYAFNKNSTFVFDKKFLKELKHFCTPYILFVLFLWILGNLDRYFLKSQIQAESLAAYVLLLTCFFGFEFIQNSLSATIFPKIFEIWTNNKKNETTKESNRYYNVFTVISILLLISFCFLIPLVIRIAVPYKASYYESFQYVGIIAAGYATRSIINFYLSTVLYSKNTGLLIKIFGYSSVIQVIATYFLVKEFGLIGAIYAGIITKLTQVFFAYLLTKKIFVYNFNYFKIIGLPLLYILFNVTMYIIFPQYKFMLYIFQLIVFSTILYFMFRNEIIAVYKQFFGKKIAN
jgi:O-antigen/teichoic acid export membrane protein